MRILCERETLREALAVTAGVIPNKSTRPAVENVFLVATEDSLELIGTDLDVAIRYRIEDVKVSEPGRALIPAKVAADFVRDLPSTSDGAVTMRTDGENFLIECGEDSCELSTIDPDEFPAVGSFQEAHSVPVMAATFTRLVAKTGFAAAREAGRYAMHGILTQCRGDELKMVATDGRRLAVASSALEGEAPEPLQAIVTPKGMNLFCKVLDDPAERVRVQFGDSQLCLKTAKAEVFARLIDGEFPRYEAVVPASTENRMEADTAMLTQKLKLVANVTSPDTRAIRMSLDKGSLTIFGRAVSTGEATAHMQVDFEGSPGAIAFNPDYLLDGLKNCEGDTVRLEFNDKSSPGKFTLGENYIYVVMPITVDI